MFENECICCGAPIGRSEGSLRPIMQSMCDACVLEVRELENGVRVVGSFVEMSQT